MNELEIIEEKLKVREDIQNPELGEELAIGSAFLALKGRVSTKKIQKWVEKKYHWEPTEDKILVVMVASVGFVTLPLAGWVLDKQKLAEWLEAIILHLDLNLDKNHPLIHSLEEYKKRKGKDKYLNIKY